MREILPITTRSSSRIPVMSSLASRSTQFNKNHFFDVAERIFGSEGLADRSLQRAASDSRNQPLGVERQRRCHRQVRG